MEKKTAAEDVTGKILGLFKNEDLVQLLMGDCYPEDDIQPMDGLQLATNCLCDDLTLSGPTQRHAKIEKALKKLAKKASNWFVVFYKLEGSEKYNLGWSDNIDYCQAFNAVLGYIQYVTQTVSYLEANELPGNLLPVVE